MRKILIVFLFMFLFSTVSFGQQEVVSMSSQGDEITVTFTTMPDTAVRYWYIPFRSFAGGIVDPDTSSLNPAKSKLEAGTWGLAVKIDSNAVPAGDDAYDSIYVWIKPMMHDGRPSANDSTFLKMAATNPSDYTATSAQRFTPVMSNRAGGVNHWYSCTLAGEIWPFAGVIVGIFMDDEDGIITPTFVLYRYR